jgi:hypothetical protein
MSVASGARPYYESVCDYLEQHHDHIREVALVGGEPLLLPENDRLLDVIPADCTVTLITNVSVELDNNRIFKKLALRRNVGWSMSFDNVNDRFEYVRYGSTWSLLLKNLKVIQQLMRDQGHWGGIHAVYNIYNATNLLGLTEFARLHGLAIHWQSLYQPECLDPSNLGTDIVRLAQNEIKKLLSHNSCLPAEQQFFETVLQNMQSKQDLRPQLREHTKQIEQQYHFDTQGQFERLWPEIQQCL